jgi:nucleotide-binding universal stress UspA family protein
MFERVLVAFDGTAESRRACRVALEVGARFGSALTVATVRPPGRTPSEGQLDRLVPIDAEGRTVQAMIEEYQADGKARGLKAVEPVFLEGEVTEAILTYLERNPHDLVVVGSRGLSRGRRLLLGSVSSTLVNEAPCPVLVVRPARGVPKGSDPGRSTAPSAR